MQAGGEVKATVMDGIIVDVTWSETLLDPAQPTTLLAQNVDLGAACSEADALCSAAGINYPTGQPTTSLRGLFESIRGQIFSFGLTVTGAINQLIANVNAMADELGIQNDHTQYQALDGLITVYTGAVEYQAKIQSSARTTASTVTTSDITLDAFAASVGNSLQDVMGLNLQALRFPSVPPGQTLVYYTSK
jgi:hypothetical protein